MIDNSRVPRRISDESYNSLTIHTASLSLLPRSTVEIVSLLDSTSSNECLLRFTLTIGLRPQTD